MREKIKVEGAEPEARQDGRVPCVTYPLVVEDVASRPDVVKTKGHGGLDNGED